MAYQKRQPDFEDDSRYMTKKQLRNYPRQKKTYNLEFPGQNLKANIQSKTYQRDFYSSNSSNKKNLQEQGLFAGNIRNNPGSFTKKFAKKLGRANKQKQSFSRSRFYSVEEKFKLIKEFESIGAPIGMFCKWYGIGIYTFRGWYDKFRKNGEQGLADRRCGKKHQEIPQEIIAEIIRIKVENPGIGSRKISDWLYRNKFVRIGALRIRKILNENPRTVSLMEKQKKLRHGNSGKEPQHFERSNPREMYQMDIMTFFLQGLYRVYVIACLDDYSRFVASIGLFRRQTTDRCLDVLRAAIERYGMPKEMLTDNGRQFYTWRGTSEFQKFLVQSGIKHTRSRPYHPETLGKIESLWRNMYQELLSKEPMNSFEDAEEKIKAWIQWYNFKRPHQGIGGLVPADRFFGVDDGMRDIMEKGAVMVRDSMAADPRQGNEPVYFIGKAGGKEIRIIAREGTMTVDGPGKTLENISKEEKHDEVIAGSSGGKQQDAGDRGAGRQVSQEDTGKDKVQDGTGSSLRQDTGEGGGKAGGGDEGSGVGVEQKVSGRGDIGPGIQPERQEGEGLCPGRGSTENPASVGTPTENNKDGKHEAPGSD